MNDRLPDVISRAPGRLPFTGERCVPWADDVQIVYEHLHRYYLAAQFATGGRVLDLGSGEGYGAAILAGQAEEVVALEIDPATVEHSRATYHAHNLRFHEGSALDLGAFPDDTFDLVVCFEVIEHVTDHERLIHEVRRVLTHDGLLLISTPNRDVYNAGRAEPNPFHVRELSEDELRELLAADFPHRVVWGQGLAVGSELVLHTATEGFAPSLGDRVGVSGPDSGWAVSTLLPLVYLVCAASATTLPRLPSVSLLNDETFQLIRSYERLAAERLNALGPLNRDLSLTRRHAREAEDLLAAMVASRRWRLLERARTVVQPLRDLTARRPLRLAKRLVSRPPASASHRTHSATGHPDPASIRFTDVRSPLVSIVVPARDNVDFTMRCLASVEAHTAALLFEVIVVDDASDDETRRALGAVAGLRIERNDANVGFLRSCNRGATLAQGRYVLFLNNDVEVEHGWLDALVDAAESAQDVAAVGSKLVYPDGRLQEAGAFIWSDATGWNYGRGRDPDAPEYNYRREVDYCSGASLLVRRDVFDQLGGFDERFAPAYYEDADLCFAAREAGFRVLYEPRSVVVHYEGASHGSDDRSGNAGGKSAQYRNRHAFAEKWSATLGDHRPPGSAAARLGGRFDDRLRVLVADHSVPAHDRDAGGLRMTWILRLLRSLGCDVTLFPQNRFRLEPYTRELQSTGVEVHYGPMSFAEFARERRGLYDLVVVSRPYVATEYLDDIERNFPEAVTLYDSVDLHFVRESRKQETLGGRDDRAVAEARETELECMRRCDIVAAVTEAEAATIRAHVQDSRVILLPTVHAVKDGTGADIDEREDLLFIGGFDHDPNVDAMLYFVHEIFPLVTSQVDARLWVIGSNPPEEIRALQSPRIIVTGYVPSADAYFERARIFVAPLRYGAGMKGKIGHALALGLPVVTTSIGAEGMVRDGENALVRDDPQDFASAVVELYRNGELWQGLARNGLSTALDWSPEVMRGRLEALLQDVRAAAGTPVAARR